MNERNRIPMNETHVFTDNKSVPVWDDDNSLTVGDNGFTVLTDTYLIEKLAHFNRERIPERVVHAKGAGAFGTFRAYHDMSKYTMAQFLSAPAETEVFVRFSTVIGSKGSADTVRDPRGFAVKFYTQQGNYDLVGNDLPVFFIRDAIKFPDVIHSLKPSPDTNLPNPERFWDFISLTPESTHMITWLYSDRGTIKSYRHVDGFGVNTYVFVNASGVRHFVKFHWRTQQGLETISREEAARLTGVDPDIAVRDLHDAIARGDYPRYELSVQLMAPETADTLPFDPLDDTKTWPEDQFPLMPVGMMTLNRNPDNFFAQVEQSAFCPGNIVTGIEFSADKMLTGRSFGYTDTQRYRIGPNFHQLPINRPLNPPDNFTQDGFMTYDYRKGPVNYSPNTLNDGRPYIEAHPKLAGPSAQGNVERNPISKTDDFTQAGERFHSMSAHERDTLCANIAVELKMAKPDIIQRVLGNFAKASQAFADGVMRKMKE